MHGQEMGRLCTSKQRPLIFDHFARGKQLVQYFHFNGQPCYGYETCPQGHET